MDILDSALDYYTKNSAVLNGVIALILGYFGLSPTAAIKKARSRISLICILIFTHALLQSLLSHMEHKTKFPINSFSELIKTKEEIVPSISHVLPTELIDFVLSNNSNFFVKMFIRLSFVANDLFFIILGLPYFVGATYIPLYCGECIAQILYLVPTLNPKKNNWPLYALSTSISHAVIAVYLVLYHDEIDPNYYTYNKRDVIAFGFAALYWAQLIFIGNVIDGNDDGIFTVHEVLDWCKHRIYTPRS